ncbi:discoidin domain receptor [Culex quinquefasciatus]|uniref:Discoidin domain receptor n=1 Tax=Culex quinquefasciatus TaxID=7176 RepID=B0WV33_CULQU|nr:discoidin domain receptor [Culex quinquefasciatus]|eukprot:XP_001860648.1 discoidin domain receptor [Culex quinquefasciatus]
MDESRVDPCHEMSCLVGPQLEIKICTLGTVINRIAYPADYCHLEGAGRQSQPMPIRWMAWESVLMVSDSDSP